MPKIFNRGLLIAVAMAAAFAALPGSTFANHAWGTPPYHWARQSNPFTLQLGNNLTSINWKDALRKTTDGGKESITLYDRAGWSDSGTVLLQIVTPGNAASNLRKCPPTKGRVEVCNYTYGTNGWLGVAQIWITGGHIYQGTVKLNDSYFSNSRYPKYNSPAWRNMVICQEVGHTFGLDHQDETFNNTNLGSCMDYTSDPTAAASNGLDNEYPGGTKSKDSDFDELVAIYGHSDTTTTVVTSPSAPSGPGKGTMPPALSDTGSDEPVQLGTAQWGKLVRSTNGGRTEMYELDLGNGHKVVTHVIWADPEEPGPARGRR